MHHTFPTRRSSDLSRTPIGFADSAAAMLVTIAPSMPSCASAHRMVRALFSPIELLTVKITDLGHVPLRVKGYFHSARHRASRSEEHTSELQSLMRISYAVCSLTKKQKNRIK